MKESHFIEKNKDKWLKFEKANENADINPGYLSRLFLQITDDLSYARTFYPNRSVRYYLNNLAQNVYMHLNKKKPLKWTNVINFWKKSLPLANYEARKEFRLSIIIFTVAFCIGVVSQQANPDFAREILTDAYINETMENIDEGNPMGIYKSFIPYKGFLSITFNNLHVAVNTFIFGLFSAIGTVFILLYNGIMIGVFQQFFIQQGLFKISFLTIWQHGAMEVICIIIAGAAGLTLGKGLLFPGTYSRLMAFRLSALRGLKLFIGIVPPIIIAGFIESYYTRHTEMSDIIRFTTIILSLTVMLLYYFWYPYFVAHRTNVKQTEPESLIHDESLSKDKSQFFNEKGLLEQLLNRFSRLMKSILKFLIPLSIVKLLVFYLLVHNETAYWNLFAPFIQFDEFIVANLKYNWPAFFDYENLPLMYFSNLVIFGLLYYFVIRTISADSEPKIQEKTVVRNKRIVIAAIFLSLYTNTIFLIGFSFAGFVLSLSLPMLAVFSYAYVIREQLLLDTGKESWNVFFINLSRSFGLIIKSLAMYSMVFLTFTFLTNILLPFTSPFIHPDLLFIRNFIMVLILFIFILSGMVLSVSTGVTIYLVNYEEFSAENLLHKINSIAKNRKILGYERE